MTRCPPIILGLDEEDRHVFAARLDQLNRLDRAYKPAVGRVLRARFVGWSDGIQDATGRDLSSAERAAIFDEALNMTTPMRAAYVSFLNWGASI